MLERTLVFVDTSYLLASFYNSWETGARAQLEIDLPEVVSVLGSMIENQLDQPIHRQLWYDGIPDSGPHRYQRALRTCDGVQLRAGQLIEWGERRTQKAVDTRLVADMVISACQHQCSDMVLVSGDADMIPGVDEATKAGARVHLYGFGWDSMSSALRHACDTTTILDPREDFADSMQLEILEGPLPPIIRNKPLGDTEPPEEPGRALIPETPPTATARPARMAAMAITLAPARGATPTPTSAPPRTHSQHRLTTPPRPRPPPRRPPQPTPRAQPPQHPARPTPQPPPNPRRYAPPPPTTPKAQPPPPPARRRPAPRTPAPRRNRKPPAPSTLTRPAPGRASQKPPAASAIPPPTPTTSRTSKTWPPRRRTAPRLATRPPAGATAPPPSRP